MNKAKETAMKLAEQVREREEKAKNKGEELLEKLFKEDLSGNLLLDPVFEEILLQEERTILPLEKLIEKVQKRKGADSNRGKNKLRLELAKVSEKGRTVRDRRNV